ncbi:MAG: phage portal protein [Candidatus Rokuibacteriota bacterium]
MLTRLRQWLGLERRSVDYADPALQYLYGDRRTSSGEPVSLERAAGLTAVWACVTLIAGTIATLPLILYRRLPDETRERAVEHPLYDVLHTRPNPVQSVMAFWEAMVTALLLRGNAYAMLTRDDDGRVRALWYLNPDRVHVEVLKTGRLKYSVATGGQTQTVTAENMLHVTGPMSDDGYTGRSVIATFRETLGLGLAAERYGGEFFANAATPRGVLKTATRLTDAGRARLTQSLEENHASPRKRHRTLVLEEGLEFQPLGLSHEDSQFVELRRFTTEEVARIFGVPPHMIGGDIKGSMTYSNSEMESLRLLKHTLGPWMHRIASAVNFACLSPLDRRQLYAEYLPDALLATDTAGRYAAYKTGLEAGFLTIDEVRRKENLPALVERAPTVG